MPTGTPVVSSLVWVLAAKFRASTREVLVLNPRAITPSLLSVFIGILILFTFSTQCQHDSNFTVFETQFQPEMNIPPSTSHPTVIGSISSYPGSSCMIQTLLSKESFMQPKLNCGPLIRKTPTLTPSLTSSLNLFLSHISLDCAGQEH